MGPGADRASGDVMTGPLFPEDSWVQVCYPLTREQEHADRTGWPWLPGWVVSVHPDYGNRGTAGRVAAELAPQAGLHAGTARSYVYAELGARAS